MSATQAIEVPRDILRLAKHTYRNNNLTALDDMGVLCLYIIELAATQQETTNAS